MHRRGREEFGSRRSEQIPPSGRNKPLSTRDDTLQRLKRDTYRTASRIDPPYFVASSRSPHEVRETHQSSLGILFPLRKTVGNDLHTPKSPVFQATLRYA